MRHVGGDEGREDLRKGPDFKQRVAIERTFVTLLETSVGDDTASLGLNDAYHDPDAALFHVNPLDENAADFRIGWCGGCGWGLCRRRRDVEHQA
jgi:hypothetical protein